MCPAQTSVSLLARAMVFPALIAAMVGRMPIIPTIAVTSTSASGRVAASIKPSMPQATFTSVSFILARKSSAASLLHITASFGANSLICFSISSTFLPAASATTDKSALFLTISSVWVPMEPVEPKIAIFFIVCISPSPFYDKSIFLL